MRLHSFTPREPTPDVQTTSIQRWHVPEFIIKPDDLYARAWDSDFEKANFESDQDIPRPPNPRAVIVETDQTDSKMYTTPESIQKSSSENFLQPDVIDDRTGTDHYRKPKVETSSQQLNPNNGKPPSAKYILLDNPRPHFNVDYRYWNSDAVHILSLHVLISFTKWIRTLEQKLLISTKQ